MRRVGPPGTGRHRQSRRPRRVAGSTGSSLLCSGPFAALSVWVLAVDLWQVVVHHRVWTGTDGIYITDQMQYLAWIRDASHHGTDLEPVRGQPTAADYFQPAIAISGGLTALGVAPWVSLLLWKPVAVVCAFFAVRAFARNMLLGVWPRRAALVLGLFSAPSASSTARSASSGTCSSASCPGAIRSACSRWRCWCSRCWPTTARGRPDGVSGWPGCWGASQPSCIPGRRSSWS